MQLANTVLIIWKSSFQQKKLSCLRWLFFLIARLIAVLTTQAKDSLVTEWVISDSIHAEADCRSLLSERFSNLNTSTPYVMNM